MASLRGLDRDAHRLFALRTLRMFAYGFIAVVLVLYLDALGLEPPVIGAILTLSLIGDTILSLWLTTRADRLGRRRVLIAGSLLMVVAGVVFAATDWPPALILAAAAGVISPTGNEVGPFLAVEQASLTETVPASRRTPTFGWYNLVGYVATASGALLAGLASQLMLAQGLAQVDAYRVIVVSYAVIGAVMAATAASVGPGIERRTREGGVEDVRTRLGLGRSRSTVFRLAALFSVDAFAGGFVPLSLIAYWFHLRFGAEPGVLGSVFFVANLLAAVSALSAARIAARIGLVNTMVLTHLPSNVLLMLIPLMPTLELAIALLLLRFTLSQMDVPTRQSYVMAVVRPEERTVASGVTHLVRLAAWAVAPSFAGLLVEGASLAWPLIIGAGMKIAYDILLWIAFRRHEPAHP